MLSILLLADSNIQYSSKNPTTIVNISKSAKKVKIPAFVGEIGPLAFSNNPSIKNIEFESNSCLNRISKYAFRNCPNLKTIDLSSCLNLWVIETGAFCCSGLENIQLPNGVKNIEKLAFSETQIKYINIPDQTLWIGEKAFFQSKLEEVIFSEISRLHCIQSHAFAMTNLLYIRLPPMLEEIEPGAFAATPLTSVSFLGDNPTFKIIDETIVTKVSKRLISSFVMKNTSVEIAPGTTEIGPGAFIFSKLFHITIPPSLLFIRERAFAFSKLVEITIPKTVLIVEKYAFNKCSLLNKLCIESSTTEIKEKSFLNTGIECGIKCPISTITSLRLAGIPIVAFQKCKI